MSGKINKKSKGTNQQPPVEPREPLNRELFRNTTPKSDKAKDKKRKRGVGESLSESPKDNESLGRNTASNSDDEQGDGADFSESQDSPDLNKIKIGKKPLSSNGLKGASGKNQTAGDDEKSKTFHVLSTSYCVVFIYTRHNICIYVFLRACVYIHHIHSTVSQR